MSIDAIAGFDDTTVTMADFDVGSSSTVRTKVFRNVRKRTALSVELRITGVTTANLTLRVLGQNTLPANDTVRLLPLSLDLPDLSALTADYAAVFLIPIYTPYLQFEVVSTSGAVHAKIDVEGTDATFDDASKASTTAALVQLAAGTAAIGKLVANAGVNIGTVDVAVAAPWIDTVTAADTSAHAYATSKVIKTPAYVRMQRGGVGTVTISDGTNAGMLLAPGDAMPFHGTNLNQLTYQFSSAAGTEKISISVGI
jgi:hypothetical protein